MSLGSMPDQIKVSDLTGTCSEYYADKMMRYDALYEGGDKFNNKKREFLPKRPIEKSGNGDGHYQSRLDSAFYTNYSGGVIDWFSAKIVENNPRIIVGDNVPEESKAYWESLNTDADGMGNPLITMCRWAAREVIVNLRSYFGINFDQDDSKDGRISVFDAVTVNDWDQSHDGKLNWIRRHTMDVVRDSAEPWSQPDTEAHFWTFYDDNQIVVYRSEKKMDLKEWPADAIATKIKDDSHELGMPVFDIRSDHSMWIMDRISQPIIKLFRREAALNWYLDTLCYQMMILNLENPKSFSNIPFTPMGAVVLGLNEKGGFMSPDNGGFESNFKAVENCKKSFYESLQILAKEASAIPQAGRLSGEAVEAMQKPMEVLIGSFAWPIEDALNRVIESLKKARREPDADITLKGFGRVSVDESELRELIEGDQDNGQGRGQESDYGEGSAGSIQGGAREGYESKS